MRRGRPDGIRPAIRHLKRVAAYVPGALWVRDKLRHLQPTRAPATRPTSRGAPPAVDEDTLRASYEAAPLAAMPDTFVLYRVIGNDLVPPRSG